MIPAFTQWIQWHVHVSGMTPRHAENVSVMEWKVIIKPSSGPLIYSLVNNPLILSDQIIMRRALSCLGSSMPAAFNTGSASATRLEFWWPFWIMSPGPLKSHKIIEKLSNLKTTYLPCWSVMLQLIVQAPSVAGSSAGTVKTNFVCPVCIWDWH